MNKTEDDIYLRELEDITFQPIFILGLHRSGTSILYKTLAAAKCFNIVTAYHIIKFDQLLSNYFNGREEETKKELMDFLRRHSQADRGIDQLPVTPDFPEEYGFLLTHRNYPWKLTPRNLPLFVELCKKTQFISNSDKPLLLKNPFDFPNFLFIKENFPEAKFIFIHRHPVRVINSFIRAMQTLFNRKNPYTTLIFHLYEKIFDNPLLLYTARIHYTSPLGVIQVTRAFAKATRYFIRNIHSLKSSDYIEVRYEDLCEKPQEVVSRILGFLGSKPLTSINYGELIKPRRIKLVSTVEKLKPYIIGRMKPYLSYCGYEEVVA